MGYCESFFRNPKSKCKFVIFIKKLAQPKILTLVLKVREISVICKTTVEIVVFVKNLRGGKYNFP